MNFQTVAYVRVSSADQHTDRQAETVGGVDRTTVLEPQLTDQDPLGMFEGTEYTEEHLALRHGDRLLLLTDGVHATPSPEREMYADAGLIDLLEATREQSITTVIRAIIDGLHRHHDASDLDDDAVIQIIDWTGPPTVTTTASPTGDVVDLVPLARRGAYARCLPDTPAASLRDGGLPAQVGPFVGGAKALRPHADTVGRAPCGLQTVDFACLGDVTTTTGMGRRGL